MACTARELDRVSKTQVVRVMDVVFIGPLMIFGGRALSRTDPLFGGLLEFFGASTIAYNAKNWYHINKALRHEGRGLRGAQLRRRRR